MRTKSCGWAWLNSPAGGNFISMAAQRTQPGKKWLASKRKRDRDIRDFIPVHGKVIKASPPHTLQRSNNSSGERGSSTKMTRQIYLSQRQERHREPNRIPASVFSKGVRRKAPLKESQVSTLYATTSAKTLGEKVDVCVSDRGKENRCDTAPGGTKMTVTTTTRCPPTTKSSVNNYSTTKPLKSTMTTHIPPISTVTVSHAPYDEKHITTSRLQVPSTTTHKTSSPDHLQPHISMVTGLKAPRDENHITTPPSPPRISSTATHRTSSPDQLQPHISIVTCPITTHTSSPDHSRSDLTKLCTSSPCPPVSCWLYSRSCDTNEVGGHCTHPQPQRHTECKKIQFRDAGVSVTESSENHHHKHSPEPSSDNSPTFLLGGSPSLTGLPTSPTLSWDTDALLAELSSCERMCDEILKTY